MTADQLIIEDFGFLQYPIVRVYPLGGKTVVQIGEPISEQSKSALFNKIEELESSIEELKDQKRSLEKDLKDTEKELQRAEENHFGELEVIELSLVNAESLLGVNTESRWIQDRIEEFAGKIGEKIESFEGNLQEEIRGLTVDNRALCDTVDEQDKIIVELKQKISNWETAYPNG